MNRVPIISLLVPAIMLTTAGYAADREISSSTLISGDYGRTAERNFWNESGNIAGLRSDSLTISFAEIHGGAAHGLFHDYSGADKQWSVGAEAHTITHLSRLSLAGSFSFDRTTFYDMTGSMLLLPDYYPVDVYEFTPGRKDLQKYAFAGGFSADLNSKWRLGAGIDFAAQNYVKRSDLRHTNYRLDMTVSPGVQYHSGKLSLGLSYLFNKNSETATAEVVGSKVANYYAFLDKGLMFGAYELWSGSGVHLSDTGISGFPLSEMSHGGAVQVAAGPFFFEASYLYGKGKGGEKTNIWCEFPSHTASAFAACSFPRTSGTHFVRLRFTYRLQYNYENVLDTDTQNGVTLTTVYGSNRIFERTTLTLVPEYQWTGKRTEFRAGAVLSSNSALSSLVYPYMYSRDILSGRFYGSALLKAGNFDLSIGAAYYGGLLDEAEGVAASDILPGDEPYRFTDCYDLRNEYLTAPRLDLGLAVRWTHSIGIYIEASARWTRAFNLSLISGPDRFAEELKVGYTF